MRPCPPGGGDPSPSPSPTAPGRLYRRPGGFSRRLDSGAVGGGRPRPLRPSEFAVGECSDEQRGSASLPTPPQRTQHPQPAARRRGRHHAELLHAILGYHGRHPAAELARVTGPGAAQEAPHRRHPGRRPGLERRQLPRLGPDPHAQHRRPGVPRRHPQPALRARPLHAVPGRPHDGEIPHAHRHAAHRDPGAGALGTAPGGEAAPRVPVRAGLPHARRRQVAPGLPPARVHAHAPRLPLALRLLERLPGLLRPHRQGHVRRRHERLRHATQHERGLGRGGPLLHGPVHRGGGAPRARPPQGLSPVPVPGAPGAAHGQPRQPLPGPGRGHRPLQPHRGPGAPRLRRYGPPPGPERRRRGDGAAGARHAAGLRHPLHVGQRRAHVRRALEPRLQLPAPRDEGDPLGGRRPRRGGPLEPAAGPAGPRLPHPDARLGLAAHAAERGRRQRQLPAAAGRRGPVARPQPRRPDAPPRAPAQHRRPGEVRGAAARRLEVRDGQHAGRRRGPLVRRGGPERVQPGVLAGRRAALQGGRGAGRPGSRAADQGQSASRIRAAVRDRRAAPPRRGRGGVPGRGRQGGRGLQPRGSPLPLQHPHRPLREGQPGRRPSSGAAELGGGPGALPPHHAAAAQRAHRPAGRPGALERHLDQLVLGAGREGPRGGRRGPRPGREGRGAAVGRGRGRVHLHGHVAGHRRRRARRRPRPRQPQGPVAGALGAPPQAAANVDTTRVTRVGDCSRVPQ